MLFFQALACGLVGKKGSDAIGVISPAIGLLSPVLGAHFVPDSIAFPCFGGGCRTEVPELCFGLRPDEGLLRCGDQVACGLTHAAPSPTTRPTSCRLAGNAQTI